MINRLYLNNCFRHQDREFIFDRGVTGIIGPNESGKSLIVEMIRYALFGSKALRGKAEDYKKLHVELDFTVAETDYSILRKGSKAELTQGEAKLAAGTGPVNEAVIKLLGYDLGVFDVANACNQGNVEALSGMTPAQRRAMVDKTVGLDQLDALIAFCGTEGNTLKREADAGRAALATPIEPEKPEGYRAAAEVKADLEEAEAHQTEYNQLVGATKHRPSEPVKPEPCAVTETAAELRAYQDQRRSDIRSKEWLTGQIAKIDPEQYSEEQLRDAEQCLDAKDRWERKQSLLAQGFHECPKCEHQWPVADLGDLADAEEIHCVLTRGQLASHRSRIGNDSQILKLQDQLDGLEIGPDRAGDLKAVEDYDAAMRVYSANQQAYERFMDGLQEKLVRIEELDPVVASIPDLRVEWQRCRDYERALSTYEVAKKDYDTVVIEIDRLADLSGQYLEARKRLQELKVTVKNFLVPSLNTVASILLSRMTGGERAKVEVTEDFEITIDDQPIATLSGSGKAVANLAIRIALGQILTARVFSVFMADEVDASMDDDRAGHTADALRRLSETLGQVLIITHKRPDTDHTFELKAS